MYCTVFFSINVRDCFFFSHSEVSFPWENSFFYYLKKKVEGVGILYGFFYYVCSLCILLCFHFQRLVSAVLHSHILNDMTKQHSKSSQLTSGLRLIISLESIVPHPLYTQSLGHWEAQTDINSGCKAFASCVVATVHLVFVLCVLNKPEHVMLLFFSLLLVISVWASRCFYQLHGFCLMQMIIY